MRCKHSSSVRQAAATTSSAQRGCGWGLVASNTDIMIRSCRIYLHFVWITVTSYYACTHRATLGLATSLCYCFAPDGLCLYAAHKFWYVPVSVNLGHQNNKKLHTSYIHTQVHNTTQDTQNTWRGLMIKSTPPPVLDATYFRVTYHLETIFRHLNQFMYQSIDEAEKTINTHAPPWKVRRLDSSHQNRSIHTSFAQ